MFNGCDKLLKNLFWWEMKDGIKVYISEKSPTTICRIELTYLQQKLGKNTVKEWSEH